MPALSRDDFDELEFDAAASGDHAAAARHMTQLALTGDETAVMTRAEAFLRAGEEWLQADEPGEAIDAIERARADGGAVSTEPRVPLARALFQLGRQADAEALLTELRSEWPADPRTCDLIAELLVEHSDLAQALEWATAGVELCLADSRPSSVGSPADNQAELNLLLRLRYRIRNDLGLPEDDYDALLDQA
ncbi:MAG TPA: tetratricopeptide repeat protein [Streptosporangiaceae bacterium]